MPILAVVLSLAAAVGLSSAQSDPRDLLPPVPDGGRYYFTAADVSGADDANDGSWERPFRTIGRGVDALQPGDTLWVREGDYREYVRVDKSGLGRDRMIAIRAMPGEQATVRGSELLTGWQRAASEPDRPVWETDWLFEGVYPSMICADDVPLIPMSIPAETEALKPPQAYCQYFLGFGRGQAAMVPGSFYYDEARRKLLVWLVGGEDPNRRRMEAAVRFCWYSSGNYLLVEGLRFLYGPLVVPIGGVVFVMTGPGGGGAPAEGCLVRNCEVALSAFEGMVVRGGKRVSTVVEDCWVHHNGNGCGGFEGQGDMDTDSWLIVRRCRLTDNNLFGWNASWHAGGKHFGNRLWFDRCEFARQYASPGLWFDCHNRDCLVSHCYAHDNGQFQLYYEIGETGAFINNVAEGGPHCAAIGLNGSSRTLVANNLVTAGERGILVGWEGNIEGQVARVTCYNSVYNNVVIGREAPLLTISPESDIARGNRSDHNVLWRRPTAAEEADPATWQVCEDGYQPSRPLTLSEWHATRGLDGHSRVADPLLSQSAGAVSRDPASPTLSGGKRLSLEDLRQVFAVGPMPEIASEVGSASIKDHQPASEAFVRKVAELLTPADGQPMPIGPLDAPGTGQRLAIANHSFEAITLAEKERVAGAPGWQAAGGVETWRPMATGLWNWYPPDGENVLVLNAPADPAGEALVRQELTEPLHANTRYRLSVWAGQPMGSDNEPWPHCLLELHAGGYRLGAVEMPPPRVLPHLGVWVEMVLTYTAPPRVPEGQRLRVTIRRNGHGAPACFDRAELRAAPITMHEVSD